MSASSVSTAILTRERPSVRTALARFWSLSGSVRYQQAVTIWLGVFCAGFCLLPAEWEQRWLFYIGIPLSLPAVIAAARRSAGGPLFWTMTAFLLLSGVSALWSDNWLTVGDELRRAFWIEYFLLTCCSIGATGMPWLRTALRAVLLFAAVVALLTVVDFFVRGPDGLRLGGYGAHAKSTWTAMIAGAIGLIGLSAGMTRSRAPALLLLLSQVPICALLIATGSRGPLPSYLACLVLSAILILRSAGRRQAMLLLGTVAACCLVASAALAALGREWLEAQIGRGDSERLILWKANLLRIAQRPWFGHGATALDRVTMSTGEIGTHAHNLFISQAFYVGLFGLALWFGVFFFALRTGVRVLRERGELLPLIPVVFLLLIGTVDIGSVVVDVQPEWLFVWVVLGISLAYDTELRLRARTSR